MNEKVLMWFFFLITYQIKEDQHRYCIEFEEGYATAFHALLEIDN